MNNYEKEKLVNDCSEAADYLRKANGRVENMLGFLKTEGLEHHDAVDNLNIKMIETARSQLSKPLAQLSAFAILLENIETTERVLAPNTAQAVQAVQASQANPAGQPGTPGERSETGHRATDKEPAETARPVLAPEQPAPSATSPITDEELRGYEPKFSLVSQTEADEENSENPDTETPEYFTSYNFDANKVYVNLWGSTNDNPIFMKGSPGCRTIRVQVDKNHRVSMTMHDPSGRSAPGQPPALYPTDLDELIRFVEEIGATQMTLKDIYTLKRWVAKLLVNHPQAAAAAARIVKESPRMPQPEAWPTRRVVYSTEIASETESEISNEDLYTVRFDLKTDILAHRESAEEALTQVPPRRYGMNYNPQKNRVYVNNWEDKSGAGTTVPLKTCDFIIFTVTRNNTVCALRAQKDENRQTTQPVTHLATMDDTIRYVEIQGGVPMLSQEIQVLVSKIRQMTEEHVGIAEDAERRRNDPDRLRSPRMVAHY